MVKDPETIDGWLFPEEGELLEKYAKEVQPFAYIVELGSYKGKSTVYLARSALPMVNVICVDTFMSDATTVSSNDTLDTFLYNTAGLSNIIVLPSKTGHVAKIMKANEHPAKIALLFIDADHSYEGVKTDFDNFSPFVAPGGVIIFHDAYGENGETENTPWPGVTRFCKELEANPKWKLIEKCRRCAVFRGVV